MNKTTLPQGIRTLHKWYEKGTLKFDLPIQRASGQWSLLQKSLLIHSMLSDYPIPSLFLVKYKSEDNATFYQGIDGKQRCTTVFEFLNGEFTLHASTPSVLMEGEEIQIANKTFEELSDDLKDLLTGFRFTIYILEDATDEEIEEVFARLNASTPLTLIQKARPEMGTELAEWTGKMTQYPFFQQAVSLTLAQARRECDLEILLQSMLLMDAKDTNYNYKAISMREVMKYCTAIRDNYSADKRMMIQCVVEYLSEAFTEKHKFLKKSNVPMVFIMADLAMEVNVSPSEFKEFLDFFSDDVPFAYEENTGSGNIKRVKTEGRLVAMFNVFADYFKLPQDGSKVFPLSVESKGVWEKNRESVGNSKIEENAVDVVKESIENEPSA